MRSRVFNDFDAFAESVRDVESKMLLRNPQRRVWSTCSVELGSIDIQLGKLGSGNIAMGELRSDGFMLYMPLSDAVEYSANGVVLPKKSLAILEPGCEFCISTKDEHDWCVAFIPGELFAQAGVSAQDASRSCRVTHPNRAAANEFRATLLQIFAVADSPHFDSSLATVRAADDILKVAQSIVAPSLQNKTNPEGRPKVPRQTIIRKSLEWLEQQGDKPSSVQDLAAAAAVSERTLRNAFIEYFGTGPVRYLQLQQLHRIRNSLKAAAPDEVTVTQILLEHGEWAFGRFATRYRRLFGERPSETLRKKPS